MKNISYDFIKQLIEKNKTNSCFICREITDENIQKKLLSLYLNVELSNLNINGSILKYEFANFEVIEYETIVDSSITKHIIVVNENKENPIFMFSQSGKIKNGNGIVFEDYKIYDENNRISFSVNIINKTINNNIVQSLVNIKEKELYNITQYLSKHYDFLYSGDECIIFGLDGNYKTLGDESFANRIEIATSHIQKLGVIFESYVKSSFGLEDEAKIYQIKRKVKRV